jgi:hypothetical protein
LELMKVPLLSLLEGMKLAEVEAVRSSVSIEQVNLLELSEASV